MTSFLDRLMGRSGPPTKASMGGGWLNAYQAGGVNLSTLSVEPQDKAAQLLRAYKVGWFNKAERKISTDFANLKVSVMPEDDSGDNEAEVIEPDLFAPWESLDPVKRFLRLMERPNEYQTGRQLRAKTMIRLDMAGWAFWYTQLGTDGLIAENGIFGISPSRLWPSYGKNGRLIGWVMDKDNPSGGVPFNAEEIVAFTYSSADDDPFGVGVVEAVYEQIPLSRMAAKHTTDLLTTGGRLAGMMWPKNRALEENEFQDAQRAWRSVASDPNAARRLLLFPEPMEWANGASTPAEIGIPELATLNRDEILTAFPISPYILGVPMPGGLNSGETRKQEERAYYEHTLHPRVELFEETVQTHIMSRYEKVVGYTLDFEVEEPNLDDAPALIEKAGAMTALIELGFGEKETVAAVGLEHIKFNGVPKPDPAVVAAEAAQAALSISAGDASPSDRSATSVDVSKKAVKSGPEAQRDAVTDPATIRAKERLERFFADQKARTTHNLRTYLPQTKAGRMKAEPPTWWDPEVEDEQLTSTMRAIYAEVGRGGLQTVADTLGRVIFKGATNSVIADLLTYGGERVKDINARTLQSLSVELAEGTRRGYSIPQLIDGVPDEGYKGILQAGLDNGVPVWSDLRAETIARTETMLSYNRATVTGYGEFGVRYLLAYDGDTDEECSARNGNEYTIDEANGISDHPNGTLVWSPVVDKASHEPPALGVPIDFAMKALELAARTGEMPTFNIHPANAPDVHIDGATIHVDAPVVNVEPAAVTVTPPAVEVKVDAPAITVEAARAPDIRIDAPIVNVTPHFESPAIHVDAPAVTVEAAKAPDVYVTTPAITVEPVNVTVEAAPAKKVTKTVKRNAKGEITHIEES